MIPLQNSVFLILGIGFFHGIVINADDESHNKCGAGINTRGWTVPKGDILLREGSSLDLYCVLDPNNRTADESSKDLIFKSGRVKIDSKYVKIINDSTALLHLDNLPAMSEMIYCQLASNGSEDIICLNMVVVGSAPKEVQNFSCTSPNWERLNCSWYVPNNYIRTNYSIYYQVPKRASRIVYSCPHKVQNFCEWTLNSEPPYRRNFDTLLFTVNGSNRFGESSQPFKINHYACVIPDAPKDLMAYSKTSSSIYLQWNIGAMSVFEKGILYKIKYIWSGTDRWNVTIYSQKEVEKIADTIRLNVTGLQFPNTAYDFRVYMRSAAAEGDGGWSSPSSIVVKTKPCAPHFSPKTDIGGFEVYKEHDSLRDVIVYWRQMPEEEQNGENFNYTIKVMEEDDEVDAIPISRGSSYAKFVNLTLNSYRFFIKAVNREGAAEHASVVRLPRKRDIVASPTVFTKVDYGGGVYELTWRKSDADVLNYTLFSCESFRDAQPCDGAIEWIHLPSNTVKHNFTASKNVGYQFALSANTDKSSSGMIWTRCTVLHDKVSKMKSVWVNQIGSGFMEIKWKLECSERIESIKGYHIYYCAVDEADTSKCVGAEQSFIVFGDLNIVNGNVSNLRPYTYYKMSVAMLTKNDQEGPRSDELVHRTKDAPPETKDIKIEVLNITENSAIIRWSPPAVTNGLIDHYELYCNDEIKHLKNETIITLTGLKSYSQYSIKIVACTSACAKTNPVALHTKIGKPSSVDKPTAVKINSTHALLSWNPPTELGGPNPVYEVRIRYDDDNKDATEDIIFTDHETKALVLVPNCRSEDSYSSYTYYVRAKNIDASKTYYGEWSPAYSINCMHSGISSLWMILIGLTSIVVLFSFLFFVYRKGMRQCRNMRSVDVILPPKFMLPDAFIQQAQEPGFHTDINNWSDRDDGKSEIDQSSLDCMDMDLETETETETNRTMSSRSSSGCYTN